MKVELTKEQIKFIKQLCFNVSNEYENYSPEEQAHRESLADGIYNALDCEEENNPIDEEKLDELAEEYALEESDYCGEQCVIMDAFKAGYHKAMEKK